MSEDQVVVDVLEQTHRKETDFPTYVVLSMKQLLLSDRLRVQIVNTIDDTVLIAIRSTRPPLVANFTHSTC